MGRRIAFLGGGRMGEALLAGVLRAGTEAGDVVVTEPSAARAEHLQAEYGVRTVTANEGAVWADVLVVAVKPDVVGAVLDEVSAAVDPATLVVSIAAGISTAAIEGRLVAGVPVIRAMPNTPAFVGAAMTAISAGSSADADDLDRAEALLATVGEVVRVPESKQDAVVAVSGSGPAYFFYVVEAMVDSGVRLGLTRDVARRLAVQTAVGAATLMHETGEHPTVLRENVTSPGGTTAAAIARLDEHGVKAAIDAAMQAARDRSASLSG